MNNSHISHALAEARTADLRRELRTNRQYPVVQIAAVSAHKPESRARDLLRRITFASRTR